MIYRVCMTATYVPAHCAVSRSGRSPYVGRVLYGWYWSLLYRRCGFRAGRLLWTCDVGFTRYHDIVLSCLFFLYTQLKLFEKRLSPCCQLQRRLPKAYKHFRGWQFTVYDNTQHSLSTFSVRVGLTSYASLRHYNPKSYMFEFVRYHKCLGLAW